MRFIKRELTRTHQGTTRNRPRINQNHARIDRKRAVYSDHSFHRLIFMDSFTPVAEFVLLLTESKRWKVCNLWRTPFSLVSIFISLPSLLITNNRVFDSGSLLCSSKHLSWWRRIEDIFSVTFFLSAKIYWKLLQENRLVERTQGLPTLESIPRLLLLKSMIIENN